MCPQTCTVDNHLRMGRGKEAAKSRRARCRFPGGCPDLREPCRRSRDDRRSDYGEIRIRALGHVDDEYYLVVYTWRGDIRRIISAWKVGEDGKKRYQAFLARGT